MALGKPVDRHRLLRQHRLHDAGELLPRRLDADRRSGRTPSTTRRTAPGPSRRSSTPPHCCARSTATTEARARARRPRRRRHRRLAVARRRSARSRASGSCGSAARRRAAPPAPAAASRCPAASFEHRLEFDLGGGDARRRRAALRGAALFRALRPYTASERELDRALAERVRRLALELEAERAALRARAAQLQRGSTSRRAAAELAGRLEELRAARDARSERRAAATRRGRAGSTSCCAARAPIPYMAGEPFDVLRAPVAGRVLGFSRDGRGAEARRRLPPFEDVFRGSRERVPSSSSRTSSCCAGHAPVLDVGCGRGELLELLRDAGIEARGVDLDAGMAERGPRGAGSTSASATGSSTSRRSSRRLARRDHRDAGDRAPARGRARALLRGSRASACGRAGCSWPRRSTRTPCTR